MLEVHSNVPLPPAVGRPRLYPFPAMDVGSAFYVPVANKDELPKVAYRLYFAVQNYRRDHGRHLRYSVRRLGDRVGVYRVA